MSQHANQSGTELDYLQAGERLRELLAPLKPAGLKEVFVATDVAAIANLGQHSPAVHVVYQGERESEGSQSGRASSFDQLWLLVLVHRGRSVPECGLAASCRPSVGEHVVTVPFAGSPHRSNPVTAAVLLICRLPLLPE
ncbi:phage tail terminator protein [Aeromonas jandaei]|uniref:phage tail terminator protein n=1 Tax=Aeromonas jandaei TaxID=650 RepID=UPI003B9F8BB8